MDQPSLQGRYEAYYRARRLVSLIRESLPLQALLVGIEDAQPSRAALTLQRVRALAERLDLDHAGVDAAPGGASSSDDGPLAELAARAVALGERLEGQFRAVPPGVAKARAALAAMVAVASEEFDQAEQIYDAFVLLGDSVPWEGVRRVVERWKAQAQRHQRLVHERRVPPGAIFWVSFDDLEVLDGLSRYRFRERFGIGEFAAAFTAVEDLVADTVLDDLAGGDYGALSGTLWLAGRSRDLPDRLADVVGVALRGIAGRQADNGSWPHPQRAGLAGRGWPDPSADPYVTALCAVALLKLGVAEPLRRRGVQAAAWLLEQQHPDGSWHLAELEGGRLVWRSDLLTSLLALEALRRSGLSDLEHSLLLGQEWVLQQQSDLGLWADPAFPDPFTTVLVLEYLAWSGSVPRALDHYLTMGRGFLRRSGRLALEENATSHQLAVAIAFQGIEALLYGLLSLPRVNVPVFERANRTIGMRRALDAFQAHLQQTGALPLGAVVDHRNELDRLAYLRDEVVHKGLVVGEAECRQLVSDARAFASRYSLQLLGGDLLETP